METWKVILEVLQIFALLFCGGSVLALAGAILFVRIRTFHPFYEEIKSRRELEAALPEVIKGVANVVQAQITATLKLEETAAKLHATLYPGSASGGSGIEEYTAAQGQREMDIQEKVQNFGMNRFEAEQAVMNQQEPLSGGQLLNDLRDPRLEKILTLTRRG